MAYGLSHLKAKLANLRSRNDIRYEFYEQKNVVLPFIKESPYLHNMTCPAIGWAAKAVDSLADRLVFKEFKNDTFNIGEIYDMNNRDVLFSSAILSALITGCSFIWISMDNDGYPKLEVIDGRYATGVVDPATNMLEEGYAVLKRDKHGQPSLEAYFTIDDTTFIESGKVWSIPNPAPYPLLVPVIYRPDAKRPMGHSRITRAGMKLIEAAHRTIMRSEITAEFYSFPQKYVTGLSPDATLMDKWKATVSTMLTFDKDEDGDKPSIGQFQAQSMAPFSEQVRTFAALFAGENGLTMDDIGFVSDNPSSAEAIKASHETLRSTARAAQRVFGTCFLNAGFLAACLRDEYPYLRRQLYLTKPVWEPIFEPDAATISAMGDGVIKFNQAVPGYFNSDNLADLTGIPASDLPVTVTGSANGS